MARTRSKPVAPKAKALPVAPKTVIVCAKCNTAAAAGEKAGEKHEKCEGTGASKAIFIEKPATPKDISRFIPRKAASGIKVGDHTIAVSEEEKKIAIDLDTSKSVWSQAFYWSGSAWVKAGGVCTPSSNGKIHAEDYGYTAASGHTAGWIGFLQNAPPCDDKCFETYLNLSRTCHGFIFFVCGNCGGYCSAYDKLKKGVTHPFIIYMRKGLWSINEAIDDAPAAIPTL